MIIEKFDIISCRENVFRMIDCQKESAIYEEVCEEYEKLLVHSYDKIKPIALLDFGPISGDDVEDCKMNQALYCITSIGAQMSEWSTRLFGEGNYLAGMLVDAIADDYLFQMEHQIAPVIIEMCKEIQCGIVKRLEAPQDISMKYQKIAWETVKAQEIAGIRIKESFMYDPVKTTCQIYLLEKHYEHYAIEHDCSHCPNRTCKLRNIPSYKITIHTKDRNEDKDIKGTKNQSLMKNLQENGVYFSAVCGGKGTCGKCKVRFIKGASKISSEEQHFFSEEELEQGYRLACTSFPEGDCVIELDHVQEEKFAVVTDYENKNQSYEKSRESYFGIAVDIGTTTIAMQLVDLKQGNILDTYSTINKQRAYGADVISRIEASNSGEREVLKKLITSQLEEGVDALSHQGEISISKMVIGANTTMVHLLMGYSCDTLGVYPFEPVSIDTIHTDAKQLLGLENNPFEIVIFPGVSTYVGGDIIAGMYALDFDRHKDVSVLIDLGTNGEMAIGNQEKILVTSTAAGPAFEGGNIMFGVGSIPGAICNVSMQEDGVHVGTIGDQAPVGICGTGVIDITSELVKHRIVDETGLLDEQYFDDGYPITSTQSDKPIVFTQKDVREIQLAKSAVRAGLETLIQQYGVTYNQIEHIYIAGGFGYKMDIQKAIAIGLLPRECKGIIKAVGNTCLQGVCKYFMDQDANTRTKSIVGCSKEINLSNDKNFNEYYMDYMYFD